MDRIFRAAELARDLARAPRAAGPGDGIPRRSHVAVGDPQAPLETVLRVLEANGLLADDGRLRGDVALYSMGDHFDWGGPEDVERAANDGLALLAWLASHPRDQVHLVLGNHDLARVGELAGFDDATFREARLLATDAYARHDEAAERALLARFPALPTAETAARDFAAFTVAQRDLVVALLRERRFRIAFAFGRDVLLSHAGVTARDVGRRERGESDAEAIAAELEERLDAALDRWNGGAFAIPGLHVPGSAAHGEGGGIFYHRPTSATLPPPNEETPANEETLANEQNGPTLGRRFDPRLLPRGITQVIGHIGDSKCRDLMPAWSRGAPEDGVLRTLVTDGIDAEYARGTPAGAQRNTKDARIVFTDGTMRRAVDGAYEILDLDRMTPFAPLSALRRGNVAG